MSNNQASSIAGVLVFALIFGALAGKHIAYDASSYNVDNDEFKPFIDYNIYTMVGVCYDSSHTPCNTYDFFNLTIPLASDCAGFTYGGVDTDGDGYFGMTAASGGSPAQLIPDPSCVVLEDWNMDGYCDHRVFDLSRSQSDSSYEMVDTYHAYIGGGLWERLTAPTPCFGWLVIP